MPFSAMLAVGPALFPSFLLFSFFFQLPHNRERYPKRRWENKKSKQKNKMTIVYSLWRRRSCHFVYVSDEHFREEREER